MFQCYAMCFIPISKEKRGVCVKTWIFILLILAERSWRTTFSSDNKHTKLKVSPISRGFIFNKNSHISYWNSSIRLNHTTENGTESNRFILSFLPRPPIQFRCNLIAQNIEHRNSWNFLQRFFFSRCLFVFFIAS